MRRVFPAVPLAALLLLFAVTGAHPFMGEGCATGACTDSHSLALDEAVKILGSTVDNVLSVGPSPVNGLWEVDGKRAGKRVPLFINIRLTPAMIFPDGRMVPGVLEAGTILSLLDEGADAPHSKK